MGELSDAIVKNSLNGVPSIDKDIFGCEAHKCQTVTSKGKCVRNLVTISLSYFLYFTGFWSLMNLQSTMNAKQGIGPVSQAVMNFCSIFSCFLPAVLIGRLGAKRTFLFTIAVSCTYIAANIHLNWGFLVVSASLYGLSAGPLNAALAMYIDEMASRYEIKGGVRREKVQSVFFGIYSVFAQSTVILGNALSSLIIKGSSATSVKGTDRNYSCGVGFDSDTGNGTNANLEPPPEDQRFMLIGIYTGLALLGIVFAVLVEPLRNDTKDVRGWKALTGSITSTLKHLKNKDQLLLITISIYAGMEGPFYSNVFTEAYIGCSWGIHHVGMVSVCAGILGALTSSIVGPLVKYTSLMFALLLAAVVNMVTYITLFLWDPSPSTPLLYYTFAGLFGMGDALWWSQLPALYGLMFPEERETAFSNLYFCCYIGHFTSYALANVLTVEAKLYLVLTVLTLGMISCITGQLVRKTPENANYVAIPQYAIDDVTQ